MGCKSWAWSDPQGAFAYPPPTPRCSYCCLFLPNITSRHHGNSIPSTQRWRLSCCGHSRRPALWCKRKMLHSVAVTDTTPVWLFPELTHRLEPKAKPNRNICMRQEFNRPINQSHYCIWKHCLRVCCTHRVPNLLYYLHSTCEFPFQSVLVCG